MYMLSVFYYFKPQTFSGVVTHVPLAAIMYLYLIVHFVYTGKNYNFVGTLQ